MQYSSLIRRVGTALETRSKSDLTLEFVKNKLIDEFRHRQENKNTNSSARETAYKVFNKNTKTKKFCNFCKRDNPVRSECYYLKNRNSGNYGKNECSKNKQLNNSNNLKNNGSNQRTAHNNPKESSNFCFGSKAETNEKINDFAFPN